MIEILATVCFKPLFQNYNDKFICVGAIHSYRGDDEDTDNAIPIIINLMVQYLGFSAREDYYRQYPGLAEDLIEKGSDHYYRPSKDDRQYYHPLVSTYYSNPKPGMESSYVNDNYASYFHEFLDPLTEAAANECLYMVPGLGEMRQYDIVRNSFSKDELWFLERWDGN